MEQNNQINEQDSTPANRDGQIEDDEIMAVAGTPSPFAESPEAAGVSHRIATILRVLRAIRDAAPQSLTEVQQARQKATHAIARERDVTVAAVEDMCWRGPQLHKISRFDEFVWKWFSQGDDALQQRLNNIMSSRFADGDSAAIRDFFMQSNNNSMSVAPEVWTTLEANKNKFRRLLHECVTTYIPTETGKRHREVYVLSREQAKQNWLEVKAAQERGDDITQLVLDKLLAHWDNAKSRQENLWINAGAPTATNLKSYYQANNWQKPEDWPHVAAAIYQFVHDCVTAPANLRRAIHAFEQSGHNKGFASGMLSPILNALRSDHFVVINRKSLDAIAIFSGVQSNASLAAYPEANAAAQALLEKYKDIFPEVQIPDLHPSDLFDMLAHWLTLPGNIQKARGTDPPPPTVQSAFSEGTFTLLEQLRANPKYTFYEEHKAEFETHLIKPFQHLMQEVAKRLPPEMLTVLETQKHIFSKIRKNDFGVGGAFDFYWGAFYPKGGKRITDAQLFVYLDQDHLDFGFFAEGRSQEFAARCAAHLPELERVLATSLDYAPLRFGTRASVHSNASPQLSWKDWLRNPAQSGVRAGVFLNRDELLSTSFEDLVTQITEIFLRLFPLMLLTVSANPLSAISTYFEQEDDDEEPPITTVQILYPRAPLYSIQEMSAETLVDEATIERWKRAIERKGQIIFYGPPGTGKTFLAQHLARHLIADRNGFWELMQFHPAYAYEDFMEGIRPRSLHSSETEPDLMKKETDTAGAGFTYDMVPGRFLNFCEEAGKRNGLCVLIIDEINRAELSRVFGELMYLLEYRSLDWNNAATDEFQEIPLAGGTKFSIPPNVRIIGTMNTADRSIALVDHALRRRFSFIGIHPDYDMLRRYHAQHAPNFPVDELVKWLRKANEAIGDQHYALGVSFFLRPDLADHIQDIWQMEIEPYLEEYFFDRPGKAKEFDWSKSPLAQSLGNQTVTDPLVEFQAELDEERAAREGSISSPVENQSEGDNANDADPAFAN